METKLKKLFDYQRFENNPRLGKLIEESESRRRKELSDEQTELVAAAGVPETPATKRIPDISEQQMTER